MNRAIIIHGWDEKPTGQWLPWLGNSLNKKGWEVIIPEMPDSKTPSLKKWLETLESFSPDENTVLIGHSLANALIMKYLEKNVVKIKGAVMVAAWDWLLEDVREFHLPFFETGFDYEKIKSRKIPLLIINSKTDPWIDFRKSEKLGKKLNAKFIPVENAGHFMERDGYKQFPILLEVIESL